jgi:hypothetical protein
VLFPFPAIVHESLRLEWGADPFDCLIGAIIPMLFGSGRFGSGIAPPLSMPRPQSEENDVPFAANDNRGRPGTMDKPVDTIDAPGKADSELGEDQDSLPQRGETR